jgi:hypothetical protein
VREQLPLDHRMSCIALPTRNYLAAVSSGSGPAALQRFFLTRSHVVFELQRCWHVAVVGQGQPAESASRAARCLRLEAGPERRWLVV